MIKNFIEGAIKGYRENGDDAGELTAYRAKAAFEEMVLRGEFTDIEPESELGRILGEIGELVPRDSTGKNNLGNRKKRPYKKRRVSSSNTEIDQSLDTAS